MRKLQAIGLTLAGLALLGGVIFFGIRLLRPKTAGVFIQTRPLSLVFLNGEQVGRTPYRADDLEPEEVIVRLIPESFDRPLAPFETRVSLVSGVETVIRREFGETREDSAGEIVSFEKVGNEEGGLSVISTPDNARVLIDGARRDFTPFRTSNISQGIHTIEVSAEGYLGRVLEVATHSNYELTVVVELAKVGKEVVEEEPEPEPEDFEKTVKILDTSTGFLRVRGEPSTLGDEVGRVEPGEEFVLLETDERTGWYRIEFEEGEEGWISDRYAEVVEEVTPTPVPTGG